MSIEIAVFDAYGTLFDVTSPVLRHAARLGPRAHDLARMWRIKQLDYTWLRTLMGRYEDLWALTEAALDFVLASEGIDDPELRQELLEAYRSLDAYPDVAPVLHRLRERGMRTAILTNGTKAMTRAAIRSAGLDALVDEVLTVEPLRCYKPDPRVYALVGERFGVAPAAVSFQSSNAWDIAGAGLFGFRTVWINRQQAPAEFGFAAPAHVLADLLPLPALL